MYECLTVTVWKKMYGRNYKNMQLHIYVKNRKYLLNWIDHKHMLVYLMP